jgi:hypothetical protein
LDSSIYHGAEQMRHWSGIKLIFRCRFAQPLCAFVWINGIQFEFPLTANPTRSPAVHYPRGDLFLFSPARSLRRSIESSALSKIKVSFRRTLAFSDQEVVGAMANVLSMAFALGSNRACSQNSSDHPNVRPLDQRFTCQGGIPLSAGQEPPNSFVIQARISSRILR